MAHLKRLHEIQVDDFDYPLPEGRIAKYPLPDRAASKLLLYRKGKICTAAFRDLPEYLPGKALLLYNNTRVIHARMVFYKETGARIEVFFLEPDEPREHAMNFAREGKVRWKCTVGNLKKWKGAPLRKEIEPGGKPATIVASLVEKHSNYQLVEISWEPVHFTFSDILETAGLIPIPPYLDRASEEQDKERYQTVYANTGGSVAAPTAGLHFTDDILEKIKEKNIVQAQLTLHVGAGTFQPVKSGTILEHQMHTEHFSVSMEVLEKILAHELIIPVGTTSLRTLESLYWLGKQLIKEGSLPGAPLVEQWAPYGKQENIPGREALWHLISYLRKNKLNSLQARTRLMIAPGYDFQLARGLITNFHQPKSTLLLLVAAMVGGDWKKIYRHALDNGFRFLSYGDSSLLLP